MTLKQYENCRLCPRQCGKNRSAETGFCGATDEIRAARAALHLWEEPVISGKNGSGTIFFCGCSMACVYCQNREISRPQLKEEFRADTKAYEQDAREVFHLRDENYGFKGRVISPERLTEIFYELEEKGANNINLVTGDIYLPSLFLSIDRAKKQGFSLPFILNTSSYIRTESLKEMDGLIDIYLADMKYIREEDAVRYSKAPGYVEAAKASIREMVRQQPECVFNEAADMDLAGCRGKSFAQKDARSDSSSLRKRGGASQKEKTKKLLKKGVIVRHLLLPGMLIQAKMIVNYLYKTYGDSIFLSLMNQYTPDVKSLRKDYPEIARKVTAYEYKSLLDYAAALGVTKGFMQVGETAEESFIPEFDCRGIIKESEQQTR